MKPPFEPVVVPCGNVMKAAVKWVPPPQATSAKETNHSGTQPLFMVGSIYALFGRRVIGIAALERCRFSHIVSSNAITNANRPSSIGDRFEHPRFGK
jgi:hypothetical protein